MSTGEKPLNPAAAWRFTMLVPDVRTPTLRQALFDWLRKLRLAMGSITDASRMSDRSRYLSEPKGPFLNAKKSAPYESSISRVRILKSSGFVGANRMAAFCLARNANTIGSPLFEIASVFVCLDHVSRCIVTHQLWWTPETILKCWGGDPQALHDPCFVREVRKNDRFLSIPTGGMDMDAQGIGMLENPLEEIMVPANWKICAAKCALDVRIEPG
jgi:hypothetical protein